MCEAGHMCMKMRGVEKNYRNGHRRGLGRFSSDPALRSEFSQCSAPSDDNSLFLLYRQLLHVARSIAGDNGKLLALIDHHGASITDDCIGVVCRWYAVRSSLRSAV